MNERTKRLRRLSVDTAPYISAERAELVTDFHAGDVPRRTSVPVRRALALGHILEHKAIYIGDGELIVGERGPAPKATPTYPELCCHSLEDLVDAAAECHGYASDVTRTFPLGGKFTRFQRDFYELVLETQRVGIERLAPGATARGTHELISSRLIEGLLDMGVLRGSVDKVRERGTMSLFLPHGTVHQIGLDVHDVCPRPKRGKPSKENSPAALPFRPGMTLAVEAACYFVTPLLQDAKLRRKHRATVNWDLVDKHLDFGGVRTEDNVLITEDGCEVLTTAPKTVAEVEAAVRG